MYTNSDYSIEIVDSEFNEMSYNTFRFNQDEFNEISNLMNVYGIRTRMKDIKIILCNTHRSPVITRNMSSSVFTINKNIDEWYTIRDHINNMYYKCDRMDGLLFQLEQSLSGNKEEFIVSKMKINIFNNLLTMNTEGIKYINDYIESQK